MVDVAQGEVYWLDDEEPFGSEPGFRRPWLVVQNNLTNASAVRTVLACPLTSNLRRAAAPGNVVLDVRETGLRVPSVVLVSGVSARDRSAFEVPTGRVSEVRLAKVVAGILGLLEPREP